MRKAPALVVLADHIDERLGVKTASFCGHSEHHARAKDTVSDFDLKAKGQDLSGLSNIGDDRRKKVELKSIATHLPVELVCGAAIKWLSAANSGRAVTPVGMEVGSELPLAEQAHFM